MLSVRMLLQNLGREVEFFLSSFQLLLVDLLIFSSFQLLFVDLLTVL